MKIIKNIEKSETCLQNSKPMKISDVKGGSGGLLVFFNDVSEIKTTRLTKFAFTMPLFTIFVDFHIKKSVQFVEALSFYGKNVKTYRFIPTCMFRRMTISVKLCLHGQLLVLRGIFLFFL